MKITSITAALLQTIPTANAADLACLLSLIKKISIFKNHDEIVKMWNGRLEELELTGHPELDLSDYIASQKKEFGRQFQSMDVDLEDLYQESDRLTSLLKDRQPGLRTWHMFLHERMNGLLKLLHNIMD